MNALEQALRLARRGIPVFPVLPSKVPACRYGFKAASADPTIVRRLFLGAPNADRIGMPTGSVTGIAVIDIDPAGMIWFEANRHRSSATCMHSTPSGGRHLFFRHPADVTLRCSAGKLAPGIDIKAEFGCITIWGPGYKTIERGPLAEFPKWILEALRQIDAAAEQRRRELEELYRADGAANEGALVRFVQRLKNGERNAGLFWAAARCGAQGGSGDALIAAALSVGLSLPEARSTVHSGLKRGRQAHL